MKPSAEGQDDASARAALVFAQLRDVNEQLVLAAVQAQYDAESAHKALQVAARAAELDALTSLPNRALMRDRFAQAVALATRHGRRLAVLFIDLNNFKQVNDLLGHSAGDDVLRRAAAAMVDAVRNADTVSRYGGDEFVMLLTDLAAPADAAAIAGKVLAALGVPIRINDHVIRLSASIGISVFPDDGIDSTTLVDLADAAMYRAKVRGIGGHAFHGDQLDGEVAIATATRERLQLPVQQVDAIIAANTRRHEILRAANERLVMAVVTTQELLETARAAQTRQTEFMAVLAHELRNPLAPMLNVSALLGNAKADASMLPKLQAILERQVTHMARLVDDLLDVSRASTGKLRLETARVDLARAIATSLETCRPAMDQRLQQLTVNLPPQSVWIAGDSVRLTQIVCNLLDNASKYTPESGEISLVLTESDQIATIVVSDSGIGIPGRAMPDIFNLFVQDPTAVGFSGLGLGIGLTVVQELVLAHGGTVVAHSAGTGLGSQFVVTLPLLPPNAATL